MLQREKGEYYDAKFSSFSGSVFPWSNWGLNIHSVLCEHKWITLKVNYSR